MDDITCSTVVNYLANTIIEDQENNETSWRQQIANGIPTLSSSCETHTEMVLDLYNGGDLTTAAPLVHYHIMRETALLPFCYPCARNELRLQPGQLPRRFDLCRCATWVHFSSCFYCQMETMENVKAKTVQQRTKQLPNGKAVVKCGCGKTVNGFEHARRCAYCNGIVIPVKKPLNENIDVPIFTNTAGHDVVFHQHSDKIYSIFPDGVPMVRRASVASNTLARQPVAAMLPPSRQSTLAEALREAHAFQASRTAPNAQANRDVQVSQNMQANQLSPPGQINRPTQLTRPLHSNGPGQDTQITQAAEENQIVQFGGADVDAVDFERQRILFTQGEEQPHQSAFSTAATNSSQAPTIYVEPPTPEPPFSTSSSIPRPSAPDNTSPSDATASNTNKKRSRDEDDTLEGLDHNQQPPAKLSRTASQHTAPEVPSLAVPEGKVSLFTSEQTQIIRDLGFTCDQVFRDHTAETPPACDRIEEVFRQTGTGNITINILLRLFNVCGFTYAEVEEMLPHINRWVENDEVYSGHVDYTVFQLRWGILDDLQMKQN